MPAKKRLSKTTKITGSARKQSPKRLSIRKKPSEKVDSVTQANSKNYSSYLRNPRLWVGVVVVVLAVFVYVYKGLFVAATVNGQPITRLAIISSLEKQNGKQVLDNLVVEALVTQEAQRRHITVTQSDIDAQMKKIEDQLKSQGATLDSALAARGLSRNDLVDQLKLQEYLTKMVGASVKVSDDDVQNYINNNQDNLPKDVSDDQLKSQVRSQLEQQAVQTKTQTFVSDLQKKAQISYFVNY